MSSLVKGIIGAVAGCILFPFILSMEGGYGITDILLFIPVGALYGFGFAFGWGYLKTITSKLLGVATGASIITIIFSRENTFIKVFFIYLFAIALAFGIAWIPGVVKGIKDIVRERRAA